MRQESIHVRYARIRIYKLRLTRHTQSTSTYAHRVKRIGERTENEAIGRGRDVHFALENCIYYIVLTRDFSLWEGRIVVINESQF